MSAPATDEPRISLLYVDDEPALLEIARLFLEDTGNYTVSTCANPYDALRIIPQASFDVIISDYQMPGCDGISFLRYLRKIGDKTPFIIFTGKGREDVVIQALNEGADFYLQKGGDPKAQFAELSNKIRYAVTRKQAGEALRESEERYRNVVETQSEFICRFLPDGTHIFVNDAYCQRFDRTAEELIGTRFKPVIHRDDRDKVSHLYASLSPENPVGIIEQRTILPNDRTLWNRWSTRAFFDDDGTLLEYQSVGQDITELMERDQQLQEKNEELHAAYEQIAASEEKLRHNLEELAAQEQAIRRKNKELEERYRFEEIVRQNVSRFIRTGTFDQSIKEALADIGTYCGASRSYIFEFKGGEDAMDNTYEWCAENVSPEIDNLQNLPTALFPWWMAHLRNGELIYAPDISLLPQEASAEREILEPQGVKSIIVLPLTIQNNLIGFIGLDNVRGTEEWSDEAVDLLRIYSDFLGSAFERRQNWRAITDQNLALIEAKEQLAASEEEMRSQLDEIIAFQRQLALSEERYRAIFEHTEAPTVILEEDTTISLANNAFTKISGYSQEEVIGRSWTEFVSKPDLERMLAIHRQRREEGADPPTQYEFTFVSRSGDTRAIHLTAGIIPGTTQSVASFHDLTGVKQAETALLESEEQYRRIVDTSAEGIWQLDAQFRITYVNRQLAEMFGYTPDEMIGLDATSFIPPDEQADSEIRRKRLKKGEIDHFERRFIRRDGSSLWSQVAITPIFETDGTYQGSFAMITDISQRKAAEAALQESEQKYRLIAENTADYIWIADFDFRHKYISPSVLMMKGFTVEEVYAQTIDEIMTPESYASILDQFHREMALEASGNADPDRIVSFEAEEYCKDGSTILVENSARWIRDDDGRPVAILGISRDITERKAAEEALKESRNLLNSVFQSIQDGISVLNTDLTIRDVNQTMEKWYDHAVPFIGKKCYEVYQNRLTPCISCPSIRALEKKTVCSEIVPLMKDNKQVGWLELFCYPLIDTKTERVTGVVEFVRDITDRKLAEEALRKSETLKRRIIEAIPDIIFLTDGEARFLDVMTSDERFLAAPKTDLINKKIIDFIPGDEGRTMAETISETLKCQEMKTIQYTLSVPAGIRHFEARIVPYLEDQILAFVRDVTEKRAAEEALHTAIKKLKLLSSITRHDIQNQIMIIQGFLVFAQNKSTDPEQARYLGEITKAATAIQRQIENTKVYESLGVKEPAWQPLKAVIGTLDDARLPIHHDCDDVSIYADPMFERVLHNLYDNTIRHAEGADCVRIRCEEQDGDLIIIWEDNGQGVPDDQKERIFDKGVGKNTGFGLFLTREILSITGITIAETGVYGEGARFEIFVPGGAWQRSREGTG